MNYLSVYSGIEAASVAWHPLGWRAEAFAEIEPFPCAVLAQRWPGVPNMGDITKYESWPELTVDLLVGGTPCQGFSIAGERGGMDDPRSQLAYSFAAIAGRYLPRWVVWENVPGVFSSGGGNDFPAFLRSLADVGYHLAWRVLDAQYFGVPQRRERVFVVGHIGDWRRAAAVLFERHSVQGNPAPSREAGKEVTGPISASLGRRGYDDRGDGGGVAPIAHALTANGFDASEDGSGRGTPLVPIAFHGSQDPCFGPVTNALGQNNGLEACVAFSCKDHGNDCSSISPTLRSMSHSGSHANAGGQVAVAFDLRGREGGAMPEMNDTANMRAASGGSSKSYIAFSGRERGDDGRGYSRAPQVTGDRVGALETVKQWNIAGRSGVRRMTPRECERLQGFPDDYTRIASRLLIKLGIEPDPSNPKHWACDGPRYKALGNSMAVPVMRWIGERIAMVDRLTQ